MERINEEKDEFDKALFGKKYMCHIILFIIILMIHIIIIMKIYWKYIILFIFYFFCFFPVLYLLIALISFIILTKNYSKFYIDILKKITNSFLIISICVGIILSTLIIINTVYLRKDYKECPFNIAPSDFKSTFEEFLIEEQPKSKCIERRCLLSENNEEYQYQYKYLCNYNPEEEFNEILNYQHKRTYNGTEIKVNKLLKCSLLEPNYRNIYFSDEIFYNYLDICYFLADFYYCDRFEKPNDYDNIFNKECPNSNYLIYMYLLCIFIIVFDFFLSIIPWITEKRYYNSLNVNNEEDKKSEEKEKYKKEKEKKSKEEKKSEEHKNNDKNNDKNNQYPTKFSKGTVSTESTKRETILKLRSTCADVKNKGEMDGNLIFEDKEGNGKNNNQENQDEEDIKEDKKKENDLKNSENIEMKVIKYNP